jgi:hypothetical protein
MEFWDEMLAERVIEVMDWDIECDDGVRESWDGDHMLLGCSFGLEILDIGKL